MNMIFEMYFDLRIVPEFEGYATVLRMALSQGGFFRRHSDSAYRTALFRAFEGEKHEYLIKLRSRDYVEELEAALRS